MRSARLSADEFLRRFLLHVLPDGLQRIRHYGFLSNRAKNQALPRCRTLLGAPPNPVPAAPDSPPDAILALTGVDIQRCPACARPTLRRVAILLPTRLCLGQARIRAPPPAQEAL